MVTFWTLAGHCQSPQCLAENLQRKLGLALSATENKAGRDALREHPQIPGLNQPHVANSVLRRGRREHTPSGRALAEGGQRPSDSPLRTDLSRSNGTRHGDAGRP